MRKIHEAFQLIQEMKKRGIDRAPYLGSDIIEAIYDSIGEAQGGMGGEGGLHEDLEEDAPGIGGFYADAGGHDGGGGSDESDGIDEDIADGMDDDERYNPTAGE